MCWYKAKTSIINGMNGAAEELSKKLCINKLLFAD